MALDTRENPGWQPISGWIKMIPFVPLTWRPQWYSLINSIFCHVNFAGSVIPNLTDAGVVFDALKWLCCTVHKSDRTQVLWQQKLKGNRVQNILKPWGNCSGCKCTQVFAVSLTSRFWWVLQRTNLHSSSAKAVSESLSKHRNKIAVQRKMSTFLSTPSCPGGVVQQKPLELLHVWEHQSREEWVWLRAVVSSAFLQRFLQYQASWGRKSPQHLKPGNIQARECCWVHLKHEASPQRYWSQGDRLHVS